ncbi:aminotransferase class I/II-fold pyridoxal phosphate-dependent enzyme [Streptomyces sp. NPDC007162]|uniref:aminotransferase class I/II-fold pyridoxal phosphate-dependent enzyme n=1 Tax=Streptomyces sp. NPDC007162 TaxID=3156917 RepID=UPI0033FE35CE
MPAPLTIRMATQYDRPAIYRLRYDVYADELAQYPPNQDRLLPDLDDSGNLYIIAQDGDTLAGFISLTPPTAPRLFIERYLDESAAAELNAERPFEVRALTVRRDIRATGAACLLMYALLRWLATQGAYSVVAMGREEVRGMYARLGLEPTGRHIQAGSQKYVVMNGQVAVAEAKFDVAYRSILDRLEHSVHWEMGIPFRPHAEHCLHGGRSFDAIGTRFDRLGTRGQIITADVLDAWFPPAPGVVQALAEDIPWLCHTSPPAQADGLVAQISAAREVAERNIVVGAGSSTLMYQAAARWLTPRSRVLLTLPTYGEYPHLIEKVVGAQTDYLRLDPAQDWSLNLDELARALRRNYDLAVLVNPANPTGGYTDADQLWNVLRSVPPSTTVWVDEAYIDYVGTSGASLERRAALSGNIVVCKTMSKAYALSGLRAAYLVAPERLATDLRRWSPPWPVALPSQIAAVRALQDPDHYAQYWHATATARHQLADRLQALAAWQVTEAQANFVLLRIPCEGTADRMRQLCEDRGVFVRDLTPLSADFRGQWVRIAVKDPAGNDRIVTAVRAAADAMALLPPDRNGLQ